MLTENQNSEVLNEEVIESREYTVNDIIIHENIRLKTISLIPTSDFTEYLTISKVMELIKMEISQTNGRVSLSELQVRVYYLYFIFTNEQIVCNIEMGYLDQVIRKLLVEEASQYQLIGGDIIHQNYFQSLAKEINLMIKWEGCVTYATLSSKFQLPLELIIEVVHKNIGVLISGIVKNNAIYSDSHFQKQYAILRGSCLGTTTPLQITFLTSLITGLDENAVLKYISDLIQFKELTGTCTAKEYVPERFQQHQRQVVDDYFKLHGIVELTRLTNTYGVSGKLIDFIHVTFPDAIQLSTSILSSDHIKLVERAIQEIVTASPQEISSKDNEQNWDGSGGIPWIHMPSIYPSGLPSHDEEPLLNYLFHSSITKSDLIEISTSEGLFLVNQRFYIWIQKQIELDCKLVGNTLVNHFKALIEKSVSISSVSMSSTIQSVKKIPETYEEEEGRGKKGKKSKSKQVEEIESNPTVKGGKKSDLKKKNQKDHSSSSTSSSSSSSAPSKDTEASQSISVVLEPFIDESRLIGLIKEWCQPIVDYSEGRIHSDCDSIDDDDMNSEDSDLLMPLYVGLWENLRDFSHNRYKEAALQAKNEASQGGSTDRLKKEQERDKKFETMWNELQIVIKGLSSLENRPQQESNPTEVLVTLPIHRFLLATRCAKIVELLTIHACWESGIEFSCSDASLFSQHVDESEDSLEMESKGDDLDQISTTSSRETRSQTSKYSRVVTESIMPILTTDDKLMLQQILPRETSTIIFKFWTLVTSERHTLWDFVEYLESCVSCGALQLVGHKIDKKKERAISFAMKQNIMDRLRVSPTIEESFSLFCTLAIHQATGSILELPRDLKRSVDLTEFLLTWFEQQELFNEEERNKIRSLVGSSSESSESLLEEVKGYVLKKK